MEDSIKTIIFEAAKELAETCEEKDYIVSNAGRHLPDRGVVIGIIKDLRRVIFPGYFGEENITLISPEYFIGERMAYIYETLKSQVVKAYNYRDFGKYTYHDIRLKAEEVCKNFIRKLPYIQKMMMKDVEAAFEGDPAAKSMEDIIFSYPGLFAIYVYRIAHEFYVQDVPFLPRIMTEYAHGRTGIDINSGATIGEYFFIDHGTGIVIGETTEIGDHVKLYQGVTLGALSTRKGQKLRDKKRHPTIRDRVTVYSGATILGGDTVIGEGVIVGGGAFITESVPAYAKVMVKNPELLIQDPANNKPVEGDWEI
ncbi:MAG: serine acetyltransferase [Eubacteriales bacterium]|nr:serine acetyltransferase [Eubacteriales bacterium]